jgi:predicted house-cleaning noncanonical NTP pyrophosphatase (MazG superfamily)
MNNPNSNELIKEMENNPNWFKIKEIIETGKFCTIGKEAEYGQFDYEFIYQSKQYRFQPDFEQKLVDNISSFVMEKNLDDLINSGYHIITYNNKTKERIIDENFQWFRNFDFSEHKQLMCIDNYENSFSREKIFENGELVTVVGQTDYDIMLKNGGLKIKSISKEEIFKYFSPVNIYNTQKMQGAETPNICLVVDLDNLGGLESGIMLFMENMKKVLMMATAWVAITIPFQNQTLQTVLSRLRIYIMNQA